MERVFIPWWILMPTAGLHVGMAIVCAANGWWIGVPIFSVLAVFSVWWGLIQRGRLRRLEAQRGFDH